MSLDGLSFRDRMREYGFFISALAPWSEFVTLTHRPLDRHGSWTRIGMSFHRRLVRQFFYGDGPFYGRGVVDIDPAARWWSETELHASGVPHEHALLATTVDMVERKAMRDTWREVRGSLVKAQGAYFEHIGDAVGAAAYVAKYTAKSASHQPRIFGFGTAERLGDAVMELAAQRVGLV